MNKTGPEQNNWEILKRFKIGRQFFEHYWCLVFVFVIHRWLVFCTNSKTNVYICVCIYGDRIQTLRQISVFVFVFMEMETHTLMSYGRRLFPVRQCWQLQSMIPIPLLWIFFCFDFVVFYLVSEWLYIVFIVRWQLYNHFNLASIFLLSDSADSSNQWSQSPFYGYFFVLIL